MSDKNEKSLTEKELYSEVWDDKVRKWWLELLPCVKIALEEIEGNDKKGKKTLEINAELEKRILERIKRELRK